MTERVLGEKRVQPAILARVAGTCARAHGTRIGPNCGTAPDASTGEGSPAPPSRAPNPKGRLRARTRSTSSSTRERRSSASLTSWRSQYRSVSMLGCSGLHVRLVSWYESAVPWRGRCGAGDRCRKEGQGSRSAGAGRVTKGRCWRGCPSAPTHCSAPRGPVLLPGCSGECARRSPGYGWTISCTA